MLDVVIISTTFQCISFQVLTGSVTQVEVFWIRHSLEPNTTTLNLEAAVSSET